MRIYFKRSIMFAPTFALAMGIAMLLVDIGDTIGCWIGYTSCSREWLVVSLYTRHWPLLVGFSLFVGLTFPALAWVVETIRRRARANKSQNVGR